MGEVFREIQSSEKSVAECLERFLKAELLVSDSPGMYRCAPRDPNLANAMTELAAAYRERRVTITELIYGKPAGRLQDFSDAFKFRKEK